MNDITEKYAELREELDNKDPLHRYVKLKEELDAAKARITELES